MWIIYIYIYILYIYPEGTFAGLKIELEYPVNLIGFAADIPDIWTSINALTSCYKLALYPEDEIYRGHGWWWGFDSG